MEKAVWSNLIFLVVFCFVFVKVQSLRAQVAQKDMFISELLDRIAIVECEVRQMIGYFFEYIFVFLVWCGYLLQL